MLLDTPPLDPGLPAAIERTVDVLSTALRDEWPGRERRALAPADALGLLRDSGLLTVPVPAQFGGKGASWRTVLDIVRRLAQCDSVVAERLAEHSMQVATILLLGNSEQQGELLFATGQGNLRWGAAMPGASASAGVRAIAAAGGFELSGVPAAHAGVTGADRLVVAARLEEGGGQLLAAISADRPGIRRPDPRVASGTAYPVEFRRVFVAHDELLGGVLGAVPLRATLRPLLEQLTLIHLFLGVAEGAFDDLVRTSRSERPGSLASADASHAPQQLQRYAELWTDLKAASALMRAATRAFEDAWAEGDALAAEERARLALDIGEARLLASRAGSQLVQVVFEVAGSAARPAGARFDRWRHQLRAHSLHDPIDFRRREIGRWVLTGELPRPSLFV